MHHLFTRANGAQAEPREAASLLVAAGACGPLSFALERKVALVIAYAHEYVLRI